MSQGLGLDAFLDAWVQAEEEEKRSGRKLPPIYRSYHLHRPTAWGFVHKCTSQKLECFPRALWQSVADRIQALILGR